MSRSALVLIWTSLFRISVQAFLTKRKIFYQNPFHDLLTRNRNLGRFSKPWMVSLQTKQMREWSHTCGGYLASRRWVLTAAHCIDKRPLDTIRVALGDYILNVTEHTEQIIPIENYFINYNYKSNAEGFPNDLGLIKLKRSAILNRFVNTLGTLVFGDVDHALCTVSGWGQVSRYSSSSWNLQEINVRIIPNNICNMTYVGIKMAKIWPSHLCAFNKDSFICDGSSGAPLVCTVRGRIGVAGLATWGANDCTTRPAVFTRLSSFQDWIEKVINKFS